MEEENLKFDRLEEGNPSRASNMMQVILICGIIKIALKQDTIINVTIVLVGTFVLIKVKSNSWMLNRLMLFMLTYGCILEIFSMPASLEKLINLLLSVFG